MLNVIFFLSLAWCKAEHEAHASIAHMATMLRISRASFTLWGLSSCRRRAQGKAGSGGGEQPERRRQAHMVGSYKA